MAYSLFSQINNIGNCLVKEYGKNVLKPYYKNYIFNSKNKTWYKTGDSGILEDGFLFINGRISENYKMSNGKFVNVAMTEANLKKHISTHFIIYGENMDYSVLIVEEPFEDKMLETINTQLESYMKIKKVIKITTEEIANFLTPKMSIKRKRLIEFVKDKI